MDSQRAMFWHAGLVLVICLSCFLVLVHDVNHVNHYIQQMISDFGKS